MTSKLAIAFVGCAALGAACTESSSGTDASVIEEMQASGPSAVRAGRGAAAQTGGTSAGRSGSASSALAAGVGASSGADASSQAGASSGADASSQAAAGASAQAGADASSQAGAAGASASAQAGADASSQAGAAGATGAAGASAAAGATGAAGTTAAAGAAAGEPTRPSSWRITFLGDSVTETSCTSQLVYAALRAEGHTNFDLVGTRQNQQGCGVDDPDRDVEGHSGYLVTNLVGAGPNAAELPMWCDANRADLVLMHFGTNDAWNSGIPITDIVGAFSGVVAALRTAQPNVIVFVAQIIPLSPDNCADCEGRVRELNAMIPMWAASESTPESPIHVVDQWTGFDPATHAYDRVHPNMLGSQKMADVWLAALRAQKIF